MSEGEILIYVLPMAVLGLLAMWYLASRKRRAMKVNGG
jgi:hypothetical protein